MLTASLMEVISVGAILPFLAVLTAPEQIYSHELMQPLIQLLNITGPNELILPLTIIFINIGFFESGQEGVSKQLDIEIKFILFSDNNDFAFSILIILLPKLEPIPK